MLKIEHHFNKKMEKARMCVENIHGTDDHPCSTSTRTRKSKTEAVLQRRSMLKLGVICKYMKRYGKC